MSDNLTVLDRLADAYAAVGIANQLSKFDEAAAVVSAVLDNHRAELDHIRDDLLAAALESIRQAVEVIETATSRDVAPEKGAPDA